MDYAANVGDRWVYWHEGPTPEEADAGENFLKFSGIDGQLNVSIEDVTGVVIQRRPVTLQQIEDGASNTYFAGEKPIIVEAYKVGWAVNDDQSCWNGDDLDTVASTEFAPRQDQEIDELKDWKVRAGFGSAHPATFQMLRCDGSVRPVEYDVDPDLHRRLGNRHDGGGP
jgi:hypothetical protein